MLGRNCDKIRGFAANKLALYFCLSPTRNDGKRYRLLVLENRPHSRATTLALLVGFISCNIGTSAAEKITDIIRENDPLSCAKPSADYTGTSACIGDAGSYQLARLALSIEAFSSALSSAGVKDSNTSIQSELYVDLGKFGLEHSLIAPAMALADISSMKNSPFGNVSPLVTGKSMIALEYLYPGTITASGLNFETVASMANMHPANGPSDFSDYMYKLSNSSSSLDDFRIFSAPEDSRALMRKLQMPKVSGASDKAKNYAADFYFPNKLSMENDRGVPFAFVFAELAARQQSTNNVMDIKFSMTSPNEGRAEYIGDTPFGGMACKYCRNFADSNLGIKPTRAPQRGGMLIQEVSAAVKTPSLSHKVISDGLDIMASEREGSISMMTSGSGTSSFDRSRIGVTGDADDTTRANCSASCAAKEAVATVFESASGVVGIIRSINDGDPYKTRDAFERAERKLTETISGEHYRPCVQKCENTTGTGTQTGGTQTGGTQTGGTQTGGTQTGGTQTGGTQTGGTQTGGSNAGGNQLGQFSPGLGDDDKQTSRNAGVAPAQSPDVAPSATNCMPPSSPNCLCDLSSRGTLRQCRHVDASSGLGIGYASPWAIKNTQSSTDRLIYVAVKSGPGTNYSSRGIMSTQDLAIFRSDPSVVSRTDNSSHNTDMRNVPPSISGNNIPVNENGIPHYPGPISLPPANGLPEVGPDVFDIYPPHTGYR